VTNETTTLFAAVSAASGSPSGNITFHNGRTPIAGCVGESIAPSNPAATCQTSFAASTSPEQITAVFTPTAASQSPGSVGAISLMVKPASVPVSLGMATTTVEDQTTTFAATLGSAASAGLFQPTGGVEFFDNGNPIHWCLYQKVVDWAATCKLTYRSLGAHTVTARYDGDANFMSESSPAHTVRVIAAPPVGFVASTMQWTFAFASTSTKVVTLVVNGTTPGIKVLVRCEGGGCPLTKRTFIVRKRTKRSTIDLTSSFGRQPLQVGARITIAITRHNWIGKYYAFTIRAGEAPGIRVACLPPGRTTPGGTC
jgi:hypothetical protein